MKKQPRHNRNPKSNKTPKNTQNPQKKNIVCWRISECDREMWRFVEETIETQNELIARIIPYLKSIEDHEWSYWQTKNQKKCHSIEISQLSKTAKDRLDELQLELESIFVMHLDNTHCLYGYIMDGILHLLWYDRNHGDNKTCVCPSYKKGDKKKHHRQ